MDENRTEIILKYLTGNITNEELKELELWLHKSPANKLAFEEIETAWIVSQSEKSAKIKGKSRVWKHMLNKTATLGNQYRQIQTKQQIYVFVRAAVVFLALGMGALIMYLTSTYTGIGNSDVARINKPMHNDTIFIEAKKGSRSEIVLPDGSKVWLNNGSKLKMLPDFYAGKRTVYLTGEAYFNVAKKQKNDFFRVKTSDIQIKVLGTEFNLKAYPEEGTIETTLEEGSVVIEKEVNNAPVQIAQLEPNEKAVFIRKQGKLNIKQEEQAENTKTKESMEPAQRKEQVIIRENIDTKLYTSWKEGHLVFKDESFNSIITRMERWYDVTIEIKDKSLEGLEFTANFKNETIHQALYALKLTHPFTYSHDVDNNIIRIE